MANTNFLQFDANKTNMLSDSAYNEDAQRLGGVTQGVARSTLYNKAAYQSSTMATALATLLVNNGIDAMDTSLTGLITSLQQAFFTLNTLKTMYPVGSIYLGTQDTCPMSIVIPGSTWELVAQNRALWGGNGTNGNTTIDAGLPNIKDNFYFADTYYGSNFIMDGDKGLITYTGEKVGTGTRNRPDNDGTTGLKQKFVFDASKVDSIYGNSETVQPPSYVINVWRRTA